MGLQTAHYGSGHQWVKPQTHRPRAVDGLDFGTATDTCRSSSMQIWGAHYGWRNAAGLQSSATDLNFESLGQLHPAHDRFQTWFKNVHSAIASYLESLIEEGEIRSTQTSVVAREICAVMDGTQLQWLRRPDDMDPVAQFDDYLSRLKVTLSP